MFVYSGMQEYDQPHFCVVRRGVITFLPFTYPDELALLLHREISTSGLSHSMRSSYYKQAFVSAQRWFERTGLIGFDR
jgi:hypothetical protein